MKIEDHVIQFVAECGGIERVDETLEAIKNKAVSTGHDMREFVANISKSKEGANMLCSAAMAGFLLSNIIYKKSKGVH